MKMKKRVYIISIISAVILLGIVILLSMYYKPHRSVTKEEAAFSMSAQELVDAFEEDEMKANSLYGGKVVEVNGQLKEVILNDSTGILRLGDSSEMTAVSCYLQKVPEGESATFRKGGTVTVKGICNGLLLDVVLDKCVVLAAEE